MAGTTGNTAQSTPKLGVNTLKDAGVSSIQLAVQAAVVAGVTAFAVQAAVVAGKTLLANVKGVADAVKG